MLELEPSPRSAAATLNLDSLDAATLARTRSLVDRLHAGATTTPLLPAGGLPPILQRILYPLDAPRLGGDARFSTASTPLFPLVPDAIRGAYLPPVITDLVYKPALGAACSFGARDTYHFLIRFSATILTGLFCWGFF